MDLLVEIGTEELPASAVYEGMAQLELRLPEILEKARLNFDVLQTFGTPRRLAFLVTGLSESARGAVHRKKGPPLTTARNEDGSWSPAAVGFARSQRVEPGELIIESAGGGEYLFAISETEGSPTTEVLPGLLGELVAGLKFSKSMRWGGGEERFSRPVRWLLGLLDGTVVDFEYGDLSSSDSTYGHRYLSQGRLLVSEPRSYAQILKEGRVLVDHEKRRDSIIRAAKQVCADAGLKPVLDEDVLEEVVQLVEWPGVVLGGFSERFLDLPREVLVHAMEAHQRYFAVEDAEGRIGPYFVAVHNGDPDHSEIIRTGHERVLTARLDDAEFFYREDLKRPLEDRIRDLEHVVYQSELGSMAEKSNRLARIVDGLGGDLGLAAEIIERSRRAALLAKCDLVTHMVVEFPDLQGIVGGIYAGETGEDERVAAAIAEQYMPRRTGDSLPETAEGALLSLAEKADNLAASFGLGHVPTGSEDPYALRRQALGIMLIAIESRFLLSVTRLVRLSSSELAAEAHGFSWSETAEGNLADFFKSRERVFFTERGYRYDLVESALNVDWDRPLAVMLRLDTLVEARESGLLERLYTGFERCHNLSKGRDAGEVSAEYFADEAERELFRLLGDAEEKVDRALATLEFKNAAGALEALCAPIDRLFDDVLIMEKDEAIRDNRLSMLARLDRLFNRLADFKVLTRD